MEHTPVRTLLPSLSPAPSTSHRPLPPPHCPTPTTSLAAINGSSKPLDLSFSSPSVALPALSHSRVALAERINERVQQLRRLILGAVAHTCSET